MNKAARRHVPPVPPLEPAPRGVEGCVAVRHEESGMTYAIAIAAWLIANSAALALYLAWVHQPFI